MRVLFVSGAEVNYIQPVLNSLDLEEEKTSAEGIQVCMKLFL